MSNLANGSLVREHSLAFDTIQDKKFLDDMIGCTPIGGIIDLSHPPTAINVELYPDFPHDSDKTKLNHTKKRLTWTSGSLVDDGRIIIPIDQKTVKFNTESIHPGRHPYYYSASRVPMADYFPLELGFYITVPKAQGRTNHSQYYRFSFRTSLSIFEI
jgi:hypothetical protein